MKNIQEVIKKITPSSIAELWYFFKYRKQKFSNVHIYQNIFRDKQGIEIGGPSKIFKTVLPIYKVISNLDGANFSNTTMWEGSIDEENSFNYYSNKAGKQFIAEATDLKNVKSDTYDFLLSSNCLEHVANPLKALEGWIRVTKPNGYLLLVLPNKESNFDHKRPITSLEHILEDYKNNITEHDLTHLDEILELHDLSRDPRAGNFENFKSRALNNFSNRGLHHHIFDMSLIEKIFNHYDISLIQTDKTLTDYFALGKVNK